MTQWGLLRSGEEAGSLTRAARRIDARDELAELLAHSVLLAHGKGLSFPHLIGHAALFPFALHLTARGLTQNSAFRVQRQGDQSDFVELA
jgi:hypothetical protein